MSGAGPLLPRLTVALARAIALSAVGGLPREQADRYLEECAADLAALDDTPRRALAHALGTALRIRRLRRVACPALPRRMWLRRALAHLGLPVAAGDARADADASYVFRGSMRR